MPIEGDRWIVTVGGWHIDTPPVSAAEFTAFAHSLADPIIADLVDRAEPLTDPVVYRFPASRRRGFDRMDRCPPDTWRWVTRSAASTPSTGRA